MQVRQTASVAIFAVIAIMDPCRAAGLDGLNVSLTGYCCDAPKPADVITTTATATVGPNVEFPIGSLTEVNGATITSESIDLTSTQIVTTSNGSFGLTDGKFNGVVFTFSGPHFTRIVDAHVDSASQFIPDSVTFTNNSVAVNVAGEFISDGQNEIIDVKVAVPEPSSALLFIAGLSALGFLTTTRTRRGVKD